MTGRSLTVRILFSILCAALLSFGLAACIVTGFGIPADLRILLWVAGGAAVLFTVIFNVWYSGMWLVLSLIIGGMALWWERHALEKSFAAVCVRVAAPYLRNFSIFEGYRLTIQAQETAEGTFFLAVLVVLLAALTAWTVNRRVSVLPLGLTCGGLFVVCLMNLSTAPAVWAILPVFGVMTLLLLTRKERHLGSGWILWTVLPVAALVLLLAAAVQPSAYQRPAWSVTLLADIRRAAPFADRTLGLLSWNKDPAEVDLQRVGPQEKTGAHVMDVLAERNGQIYLRGYSMANYDGRSWHEAKDAPEWESPSFLSEEARGESEKLVIRTDRRSKMLYLPYAVNALPEGGAWREDRYAENTKHFTEYTISYTPSSYLPAADPAYEAYVRETYLQVPEETRATFANWVAAVRSEEERVKRAYGEHYQIDLIQAVTNASVGGKPYSLDTAAPPQDADFVSWFWRESESGYCVHFASTAVIMLRCLDIPARYVSGYLADVTAGRLCAVTADDAHAWVEYYVSGEGWRLLDVTPMAGRVFEPQPEIPDPRPDLPEIPEAPAQPELPVSPEEPEQPETPSEELPPVTEEPDTAPKLPLFALDMPSSGSIEPTARIIIPFWIWVGALLLLLLSLPVFWVVVIPALLRRWRNRGDRQAQTRRAYRRLCRLARLSGERIPEWAETLALRAAFGKAPITPEELTTLQELIRSLCRKLRRENTGIRGIFLRVRLALEEA